MTPRRVLICGAACRDFHNFNVNIHGGLPMGVRKSTGKNKKSKARAAAVAVKREETLRRGAKHSGRVGRAKSR